MRLIGSLRSRRPIRPALVLALAAALALTATPPALAATPEIDMVYADGHSYQMLGATLLTQASSGLLSAPPLYLIGFPAPSTATGPLSLPSGYSPQCDPCDHSPFHYHDHVLTGAPGLGTSGTASGDYRSPWRIVVMLYTHGYAYSPSFVPITDDAQIPAAEAAGELVPINRGAGDPYQVWTDSVLICPIVSAQV